MMKMEKVYDRIFVEYCKIGDRAIIHVEKNGTTERIQTSVVENYSTNCTGAVTITTTHTVYRCY